MVLNFFHQIMLSRNEFLHFFFLLQHCNLKQILNVYKFATILFFIKVRALEFLLMVLNFFPALYANNREIRLKYMEEIYYKLL